MQSIILSISFLMLSFFGSNNKQVMLNNEQNSKHFSTIKCMNKSPHQGEESNFNKLFNIKKDSSASFIKEENLLFLL